MLTELSYAPNQEDLEPGAIDAVIVDHATIDPTLAKLLRLSTDPAGAGQALFAVDAFVVLEGAVFRQPVGRPFLWRERALSPAEVARLDAAILDRPADFAAAAWIVLVGAPWRHMMFYGPRGLRRTLIDVGRALMVLGSASASLGLTTWQGTDVIDHELESLLLLDGVERFVAGVFAISAEARDD